jgi:ectoine hydroxylase-related dioxygenase (phytanoyl-CoA dioxygenase family)
MNRNRLAMVCDDEIATYDRDGVVCLRDLFAPWIERMRRATDEILEAPTAYALDSNPARTSGKFTRDRFLSLAHPAFRAFSAESPAATIAAAIMRSQSVYLMTDLVFSKEPHTPEPTPWHHDKPYGWYEGTQLCQLWIPLDHVDLASGTMEFVRGSHRWGKLFSMRSFGPDQSYENVDYEPVPDIEADRDRYDIVHFEMAPGDCVVFSELTLHAAPGNGTDRRRRAIAIHYAGDDATFVARTHSRLPFTDHGLVTGDPFGSPCFPRVRRIDCRLRRP